MQEFIISGIQQIGIGVPDVYEAWKWQRKHFHMDIPVFDEAAEAALMLPYTDGEPRSRHAVLALNTQGGGGMEIWQYTSRVPQPPQFDPQLGDLGIYICKIKTRDVAQTYARFQRDNADLLGEITETPEGLPHFYMKDDYGNIYEVVSSNDFFKKDKHLPGGVYGVVIGSSDIDQSMKLYRDVLGYDEVVYDVDGVQGDLAGLPNGDQSFRRVLLRHKAFRKGSFSQMLGRSEIELIEWKNGQPKQIFQNRMWGDLGYIHLCFDVNGFDSLRKSCHDAGFPFTVDSSKAMDTFDMGEAAGNFAYIEDPDGTLIEFVETHKLPIMKKLNWYLDLRKRNPEKPLPKWMLKAMALNRVKN